MEEYRPNSHKSKEEQLPAAASEKKVEKVISGSVKTRKKSEIRKFADVFLQEDTQQVKSYILTEVLVPAVKKAISDTVDLILYGEAGHTKKSTPASRVSYRSYYDQKNDRRDNSPSRARTGYDYDDVILDTRGEAEEVLARIDELISVYGIASVADFYELVGITGNYTDYKYGWTDIRSASVVRVRGDGYMIKMPRALPLN